MLTTRIETGKGFANLFGNVLERIRVNVNVELACGEFRTVGYTTIIPIEVAS